MAPGGGGGGGGPAGPPHRPQNVRGPGAPRSKGRRGASTRRRFWGGASAPPIIGGRPGRPPPPPGGPPPALWAKGHRAQRQPWHASLWPYPLAQGYNRPLTAGIGTGQSAKGAYLAHAGKGRAGFKPLGIHFPVPYTGKRRTGRIKSRGYADIDPGCPSPRPRPDGAPEPPRRHRAPVGNSFGCCA